jgi:hypothetical protein
VVLGVRAVEPVRRAASDHAAGVADRRAEHPGRCPRQRRDDRDRPECGDAWRIGGLSGGPPRWTRADGRLSILDASDGALDSIAADATRYIPTGPLSVENIRLITAGWLSMNPGLYVFLALLMALCLSATTTHLVRNVGRRQE